MTAFRQTDRSGDGQPATSTPEAHIGHRTTDTALETGSSIACECAGIPLSIKTCSSHAQQAYGYLVSFSAATENTHRTGLSDHNTHVPKTTPVSNTTTVVHSATVNTTSFKLRDVSVHLEGIKVGGSKNWYIVHLQIEVKGITWNPINWHL